ncbi:MAG: tetratricopeptide repeat protein, partial [Candidatus Schekmanbacteria bacterium]|nr:tetratricopeptide repeat protein [Candidatus Schekmanbacteria bacterium]
MRYDSADRIGPYRLLAPLGQGGMGVVYRAEHAETAETVALKTVRLPDAGLLQSIRREIRALARLRHPGIIRIVAEGLHEGMPWYAMEHPEGVTLRRWTGSLGAGLETAGEVSERRDDWWTQSLAGNEETLDDSSGWDRPRTSPTPPPAEARTPSRLGPILTLVRRLCAPLAFLHGEGIVHRDLKPENILVRPDGRPVIVDFGLAASFAGGASREALSVEAGMAGTVSYMAPEQIRGELVDARADLYALGCILYELLTKRRPFAGAGPFEVLRAQQFHAPMPLRQHVEDIPAALDELVHRLLAKAPRDRIGYADVVASALAELGAEAGPEDRGPAPRAYLYRSGLSGRSAEMSLLRGHLQRLEDGAGGIALLGGESGVGKTRLATEIAREALGRGVLGLGGECLDVGGSALQPFRKPLQAIADRCRERGCEETDRLLGRRGKLLAIFEPALAGLPGQESHPEPAELTGDAARLRILTYLADTFEALAADEEVLLVLDDLQWADVLSLDVLAFLLRSGRLERVPLAVLGTYRTEEVGEDLGELIETPGIRRIVLDRLAEGAVAGIVGDMLALSSPPELFSRYLARHSEGNPFFAAEYLRLAVEEGVFFRNVRGEWEVAVEETEVTEETYAELPIPRSLRDLVGRRLAGLSEAAARLIEAGAVIGREAGVLLLWEMTRLEEEDLVEATGELVRRQVLEESAAGELRFVHDKIREVAEERIEDGRRPALHRAAAEGIEALHRADREHHLAELGRHWRAAGERGKARACFLAAARQARERWTLAAAVPLFEAYLALIEEPTAESIEARRELASQVLRVLGQLPEAGVVLGKALAEARGIGDRRGEGNALGNLAILHREQGRMEEAQKLYEQALVIHREVGNRREEGNVLGNLAILHQEQGRMEEARQLYDQALVILREVGNRPGEGIVLGNLATLHREQGRMEEARQLYEQALVILREVGNRPSEANALGYLATLHQAQGRMEEARQLHEQAIVIHREVGNRQFEGIVLGY